MRLRALALGVSMFVGGSASAQQLGQLYLRAVPSSPASVSTTFPGTESTLSESGVWLNGLVDGLLWANVETTTNRAFGTQTAAQHGQSNNSAYNDSQAFRKAPPGTYWHNDQDVRGRVFITSRSGWTGSKEVQLATRWQIDDGVSRGYEGIFSAVGGTTYHEIVKWTGIPGFGTACNFGCAFVSLVNVSCAGVEDGTYVRFTSIGTTHTMYTSSDGASWAVACSGTATVTDSAYASGLPGMMFWTNGNGAVNTYGLSQWSAQQGF